MPASNSRIANESGDTATIFTSDRGGDTLSFSGRGGGEVSREAKMVVSSQKTDAP